MCVYECVMCVLGGGQISELYFFNSIYIAKQLLYLILALHHRLDMHVVYLSCQPSWEVICHFHNPMLYGNNYDTFHILSARDLYNCENVINRSENTHTHSLRTLKSHCLLFKKSSSFWREMNQWFDSNRFLFFPNKYKRFYIVLYIHVSYILSCNESIGCVNIIYIYISEFAEKNTVSRLSIVNTNQLISYIVALPIRAYPYSQ